MGKIFRIIDEHEGYDERGHEEYGHHDDHLLEKAFKEGCEHGYRKAMRESGMDERGSRGSYREGFEEKIHRLKEKYK